MSAKAKIESTAGDNIHFLDVEFRPWASFLIRSGWRVKFLIWCAVHLPPHWVFRKFIRTTEGNNG
jgi:hypothetical protein